MSDYQKNPIRFGVENKPADFIWPLNAAKRYLLSASIHFATFGGRKKMVSVGALLLFSRMMNESNGIVHSTDRLC